MLVLDTGALIALDRGDDRTWAALRAATRGAQAVQVPVGALAQAWRDGSRQARLARALKECDEIPLVGNRRRVPVRGAGSGPARTGRRT